MKTDAIDTSDVPPAKPAAKPKAETPPAQPQQAAQPQPQRVHALSLLQLAATIASGSVSLTAAGAMTQTHDPKWIAKQAVAIARALVEELNGGGGS